MKIYVVVSALDLSLRLGCTPSWWQLFKALNELGHELVITPYIGRPIESLWWRTTGNPVALESRVMNGAIQSGVVKPVGSGAQPVVEWGTRVIVEQWIRRKWRRHILETLSSEGDVDAVLFVNTPLNHLTGVPSEIKRWAPDLPVIYLDGDLPSILPAYFADRRFKMSYYDGADLAEYDAVLVNSEGAIPSLEKLGAHNVRPFHYAVDPELFAPPLGKEHEKDIDVFYYAHGSDAREERINFMVTEPSRELNSARFLVGGRGFGVELGASQTTGVQSIETWRNYVGRSKINLNITRSGHASVFASSTARPFELAGLGACIVSDPYSGLETWFEPGREVHVATSSKEATELYRWLLDDDAARRATGAAARARVLRDHTYARRAQQLVDVLDGASPTLDGRRV